MCKFLKSIAPLLGAAAMIGATVVPAAASPSPVGNWLTEKKSAIVEIFRCAGGGEALCGRLVWFRVKPDDPEPRDSKNPDPTRRGQPLCGLGFLQGFKPTEPEHWEDGTVYDPESGNTYHATLKLEQDGALRLRGYLGISLLGRSEVWTRYTQQVPSCPTRGN